MLARLSCSKGLLSRLHHSYATITDAVVVGAGHNGLVAATLLARQGLKVCYEFLCKTFIRFCI